MKTSNPEPCVIGYLSSFCGGFLLASLIWPNHIANWFYAGLGIGALWVAINSLDAHEWAIALRAVLRCAEDEKRSCKLAEKTAVLLVNAFIIATEMIEDESDDEESE